jgi:hypothetical protein
MIIIDVRDIFNTHIISIPILFLVGKITIKSFPCNIFKATARQTNHNI